MPSQPQRLVNRTRYQTAKMMLTSPFESLPIEIINNIMGHLDGHYVILLRRVSRTFNHIFSCHDVVSHALAHNYPYSSEAELSKILRTKGVFDTVARRTYTQPRRRNHRAKELLNCFPILCEEEEEVLVYKTGEQVWSRGWECTLRDLKGNTEVKIELLDGTVGGCYNGLGELHSSAILEDIRCYKGRGVMMLLGCHRHLNWASPRDTTEGEFNKWNVELGHHGVHVAPSRTRHSHTFIHVYSLNRKTLGQRISSFSFYGNTPLNHSICNKHFFAACSGRSIFIYKFPKEPENTFPPPALYLRELLERLPQSSPAIWVDIHFFNACTLAPDSLGKFIFMHEADATVVNILSTEDGKIVKSTRLRLGEIRECSAWYLARDDSRLISWRFEHGIQKFGIFPTEYEEVRLTWVGTYGLDGTRGHRIDVDRLGANGDFTGRETPVMAEWRVNTLGINSPNSLIYQEKAVPTLYFSPTERYGTERGGVMDIPAQAAGWEEVKCKNELVRWPVGVNGYRFTGDVGQRKFLKWGGGVGGFYTTASNGMEIDRSRTVTLWYEKNPGILGVGEGIGDGSSERLIFPRWKSVLDNSGSGNTRGGSATNKNDGGCGGQKEICASPKKCQTIPGESERDRKRQLEWEKQREKQKRYQRRREYLKQKEEKRHTEQLKRQREKREFGEVDNRFFYEGCGWILYRLRKGRQDWGDEDKCKGEDHVEIVDYDDVKNNSNGSVDEDISMPEDEVEDDGPPNIGLKGGSNLVYLTF